MRAKPEIRSRTRMRSKPSPESLQRLADEDLMTLVDAKESDAFAVVYDRHGGAAYSLAHRIVGEGGMAEDVTQEAFLSIWRSTARFDAARGSVRAWILGILRNRAIDALRRAARPAPKLDLDDDAVLETQAAAQRTEAEAIRRETADRLRRALGLLPREQSQVIELAYFGGFSHSEIADMVGAPIGTIKGRMRLGLEKIRAFLAEGFPEEDVPGAYL